MPIAPRRFGGPVPQVGTPRIASRPLLLAGLVLVALSGAFLIGLAVVGLIAAAVGAFDLVRRRVWPAAKPFGVLTAR
jgi:hypothetical protein